MVESKGGEGRGGGGERGTTCVGSQLCGVAEGGVLFLGYFLLCIWIFLVRLKGGAIFCYFGVVRHTTTMGIFYFYFSLQNSYLIFTPRKGA